jgi:uncharacterized protein
VTGRSSIQRLAAWPFRAGLIGLIRLYRATLSGWLGGRCRFYPSCSRYAEDAIRHHGAAEGSALAIWRILRCNPFGRGGVDHVPGIRRQNEGSYENLIRTAPPA